MNTFVTRVHSRREARRDLENYGFTCPFITRWKAWIALGIIAAIALAAGLITLWFHFAISGADMVAMLITIGGLTLAYQQWYGTRHEMSLQKFYERLEVTNQRLDNWPAARPLAGPWPIINGQHKRSEEQVYERAMYVYRELDSLEYAVEKYRLGFMDAENAHRCLRTFYARCQSSEFRELALHCVTANCGYSHNTIDVVNRVHSSIESALGDTRSVWVTGTRSISIPRSQRIS
jgi:hypothetical protein